MSSQLRDSEPASAAPGEVAPPFIIPHAGERSTAPERDVDGVDADVISVPPVNLEDIVGDEGDEMEILELVDIDDSAEYPEFQEEASPAAANEPAAVEELPDWMNWIEEPEEQGQPEPVDREPARAAEAAGSEEIARPAARAASDAGTDTALTDAVSEVADRLERIAASLRRRPAAELLSGSAPADPLDLLITGFVFGYSQRPDRPADPDSD